MAIELEVRGIKFVRQPGVLVHYKGKQVGEGRMDFMVEDKVVLELKAIEQLIPVHKAQVVSYLKSSGRKLGLLINFNVPVLKDGIKRVVWSR